VHAKRFKQLRDIMKSHLGTDTLDKFMENSRERQEETHALKQQNVKDGAFKKWTAHLPIGNSDQSKHGPLLNALVSQFSMENNQHPKMIAGAADMPSNHKHDRRSNQGNRQQCKSWHAPKKEDGNDTLSSTRSETSFAQGGKDQICCCCGEKGHVSPECPDEKTIKKKDWHVRKPS
jgi:hypothetical protein